AAADGATGTGYRHGPYLIPVGIIGWPEKCPRRPSSTRGWCARILPQGEVGTLLGNSADASQGPSRGSERARKVGELQGRCDNEDIQDDLPDASSARNAGPDHRH